MRWWISFILLIGLCLSWGSFSEAGKPKMRVLVDGKKSMKKLFRKSKSCEPLLSWSDFRNARSALGYDVAVYYALNAGYGKLPELGERVFYVEGLNRSQVKVTPKLDEKTKYLWSIRVRDPEGKVGEWMTHTVTSMDALSVISGSYSVFSNIWFGIKTPKGC